jgi:RNA polymerase sigma-70 factor (ECF subfamily)
MSAEVSQREIEELVKRAQSGSVDDFHRLYRLYAKPVYNFIWRLVGSPSEAEDLTQETFLKVHSELKNLRDVKQFRYWLYRIARNEVYQKLRRSLRRSEVSIDNEEIRYFEFLPDEAHDLDPEARVLSQELDRVLQTSLMALKPKYRDVFILAVFEKMSYEEISKIVGRSLLSVKTDIYRARLAVKETVGSYLSKKQ